MYSVRSYIYSVSSYFYSVTSYIYSVSAYLYLVTSYIYSVSSYLYLVTSLYNQSHLILFSLLFCIQSHLLCRKTSCRRFRNNQAELRKRGIKKDKNIENKILNSNKNVVEKTETWKTLEEFILYSFIYFISSTVNFILMILLINQWYLESQKPLVTLLMSKKKQKRGF